MYSSKVSEDLNLTDHYFKDKEITLIIMSVNITNLGKNDLRDESEIDHRGKNLKKLLIKKQSNLYSSCRFAPPTLLM